MSQFARPRDNLGLPDWLIFIRIAQGALALLILILSAIAANKFLGGADPTYLTTPFPGFGFCWFAFAWTTVYLPLAILVIPRLASSAKPLIFLFVLECLSTLWWLVTFALMADDARKLGLVVDYDLDIYGFKPATDMTRADAALSAGEFVLFGISLAFVGIALFGKKKAPGRQMGHFVMSDPTVTTVQEYPKDTQQNMQIPQPTGSELSATRYP